MSYRKINIHGKTYEYAIGRKTIKIKDFGLFPVAQHGNPVSVPQSETIEIKTGVFIVTPAVIRAIILGEKTPLAVSPDEIRLMPNPYFGEIMQKIKYWPYNYRTYHKHWL